MQNLDDFKQLAIKYGLEFFDGIIVELNIPKIYGYCIWLLLGEENKILKVRIGGTPIITADFIRFVELIIINDWHNYDFEAYIQQSIKTIKKLKTELELRSLKREFEE